MKFFVDENIPHSLIRFLKEQGHDVIDVKKSPLAGATDYELAKFALQEKAIILTFDKDFLGIKKTRSSLKCIFLSLRTLEIKRLKFYLKIVLDKYKTILESESFLIICKEKEISIIS